ncbi:pantoate--beta-alanine ligase [Nannocystaceae bacterium ST9]
MLVLRSVSELRAWRAGAGRVALIPTMGFLHEGHLELLREGRRRVPEGSLALSIFVNPTQFNDPRDLASYPRDEVGDLAKAASVGVDMAFCPTDPSELYPADASTWIEVEGLDRHLCGATRPGHFRGVCTIVGKLLALVRPDYAIFGQKDFQQLAIVRRMHRDLLFEGEIVGCPTFREPDGLAMSSRNVRLSAEARSQALAIPGFLELVRRRFAAGERRSEALLADAEAGLVGGRIDYVSLVDAVDLQPIASVERPALVAVAVFFGGVRLIDNTLLG